MSKILTEQVVKGRVEVDSQGLKEQLQSASKFRIVQEIIANSFDEDTVKNITVEITQIKDKILVKVEDDGSGFMDWKDIFTMYGHSYKRSDPTKRGRFNLGEKQFFVLAESGFARTGKINVVFEKDQRRIQTIDEYSKSTIIQGIFGWNKSSIGEIMKGLTMLIVPQDKNLTINGEPVNKKEIVKSFKAKLWTPLEDEKTRITNRVKRETHVDVYKVDKDAWLFELGVPVCRLKNSMMWNIDVRQKIPQTTSRNVVSQSYLTDLYGAILDNMVDEIDDEKMGSKWIPMALSEVNPETAKKVFIKTYGTDNVFIPSSDEQDNDRAKYNGGELIKPNWMDGDTRRKLEGIGLIKYASEEFGGFGSATVKPVKPTEKMLEYANIVRLIAEDVLNKKINIKFVNSDWEHPAWYSGLALTLTYNLRHCGGKNFFNEFTNFGVGLIIHELSHDKKPNNDMYCHLTKEFTDELERIGGIVGKRGIEYWINKNK